ncbi:antibiotic biosynthesis monooxygenase family protein [Phaeobacter sp.]|uniref:putative quinol monooxygenase n=1 Tax=Phaeobacter sp. TaxID=1902409 RepID=UPI0025F10972|nr:antibiotic biosynthesis monooxygenase family protein [Phaeobacter sp.]
MKDAVVVSIRPNPEDRDQLIAMLEHMIIKTRAFPGCHTAYLLRSTDDDELQVFHIWDTAEALDNYLTWRAERGDFMDINALISQEQIYRSYLVV